VIRPRYEYAGNFTNGYAFVRHEDKREGLIDRGGKFYLLNDLCGGRTPVMPDRHYFTGFDDLDNVPSRYADVCTVDAGRIQWGLINTQLEYIALPDEFFSQAENVRIFGEFLMIVNPELHSTEKIVGLFNLKTMALELPCEYSWIIPSLDPIWVVVRGRNETKNREHAFYDLRTHKFIPGWYHEAQPFSEGLGIIRAGQMITDDIYYVDEQFNPVLKNRFWSLGRFSQGLAHVFSDEWSGYIDRSGNPRIHLPGYEELTSFNPYGYAIANRGKKDWVLDIIDRNGKARLRGFETAAFSPGDFPYFELSWKETEYFYDMNLNLVHKGRCGWLIG
jgi:WG containing repeat